MESYKQKSRLITLLAGAITLLTCLTSEQISTFLPIKYQPLAPAIVTIIAFLASQLSEEKRVVVAEELVLEKQCELENDPLTNDYEDGV